MSRGWHLISEHKDVQSWALQKVQEPHNGGNGQRRSANKWGRTSICARSWSLRDSANTRGHACSATAWKTLRRARLCTWVDQRSKATSNSKWKRHSLQDGKFSYCCRPGIVFKLRRKVVFYIASARLIKHFFESSKTAKWRYLRSSIGRPRRPSPNQKKQQEEEGQQSSNEKSIVLLEPLYSCCTVGHITAWCSGHDNDFHVIHRRLGPKSDIVKQHVSSTVHSAHIHVLRGFHSCMVAGQVILELWYWFYSWYWDIECRWHLLKKSRCLDVSSMSSRHRWLKCVNSRRALRWTQRSQDPRKPWEQWDSRCRNRAQRTWESGSQSLTHLAKNLTTGILHSTDTPMLTVRKAGNKGFGNSQTTVPDVRNVRSGRQHGTFVEIMTNKFGSKIEDVQDPFERIFGTGETIRWGDWYRSGSRPSEKGVHYF